MKKAERRMRMHIIAERPQKFRSAFAFNGRGVVVFDDAVLFGDPDASPGVMKKLVEAWQNDDVFMCVLLDVYGAEEDAVCSMAGYGSPAQAALAAMRDYWTEAEVETPSESEDTNG